jgi:tetratricopeptide (TPR) repeat protein
MQMKQTSVLGLWALTMVLLLAACGESHEAMLRQLEALEQMNRADSVMTNDSLAEALTNYFDSHGTANERLRAHYILGRTYADMGEAPRALDCYYDALSCADTTATDCDFRTLIGINGQMAVIFHQQNLPQDEIQAVRRYIHYMQKAYPKDTLKSLIAQEQLIRPYYLMGQKDSVLQIIEKTNKELLLLGHNKEAARVLITSIYIYIERNQLDKAGQLLDTYEKESCIWDNNGNILKGRETYYWVKGFYELGINKIDSAEYYFRKAISHGDFQCISNAYKGMLTVYQYKHNIDSVVYYSHLNEVALDSLHNRMQTDAIHQTSALYDYTRSEKLAEQKTAEAEHSRFLLLLSSALGVAVVFGLLLAFSVYRKRKQAQLFQYQRDLEHLERAQTKLQELRSEEQEHSLSTINSLSEEIATLQRRVAEYAKMPERRRTETSLMESDIVTHLRELLGQNPPAEASLADMQALKSLVNEQLPMFYGTLNTSSCTLNPIEYEVCLLIRVHFSPADICKLLGRSDSYISHTRRRILQKVYGIDGKPKDLDDRILAIQ